MTTSLLQFELYYHLRQRSFYLLSLLFLLFGYLQGSRSFAVAQVDFNAPYQISYHIGLSTLGCMFAIMFYCVNGVLRDRDYQMEGLIFSTPVSKSTYFWSRFLGVFSLSLATASMVLLGFALGTLSPMLDPDQVAPFQLGPYLWAWGLFILPNVLLCSVLVFAAGLLTKKHLVTYLSAILIYALYWLCAISLNSPLLAQAVAPSPEGLILAAIGDPFGLSAFFEQTQYWTPFEKNSQWIKLTGYFAWNRLLWLVVASGVLAGAYHLFSFRKGAARKVKEVVADQSTRNTNTYRPTSKISFDYPARFAAFRSLVRIELTNVFKSLPFLAVMGTWLVILITEIYTRINHSGNYNDSPYPTTNLMVWLIEEPLVLLSLFLCIFYSGEIIWRERALAFNGITDSTPVPNRLFFLAKATALLLLPVLLILTAIAVAVAFQLGKGYHQLELWQYLHLFYYSGIRILYFALFTFFIQSLVPHKYWGMGLSLLLLLGLTSSFALTLGLEHPLSRIGTFPTVEYNNMNGYGDAGKVFHYFAVHWTMLGALLTLLSFKLWPRGVVISNWFRLRHIFSHWTKKELALLVVFSMGFLATTAIVFYHTNIAQPYRTQAEQLDRRAEYERTYKRFESQAVPILKEVSTEIDLFPNEGRYVLSGDYQLKNIEEEPITELLVNERDPLVSFQLQRAQLVEVDSSLGVYRYRLDPPLLPGETIHCHFEVRKEKTAFEQRNDLVANGSYLNHHRIAPSLGYRSSLEITNHRERQKRRLPPRPEESLSDEHLYGHADRRLETISFETVISTSGDQTALSVGDLVRSWTENGRNYFHYRAPVQIAPAIQYATARYEKRTTTFQGIDIEHYFHPGHDFNHVSIIENTKRTLAFCSSEFGEFPFPQLRIAELPGHWPFGGHAQPGLIAMVEDRLYLIDNRREDAFDLVAKRSIHEVAHQWWGILLSPKYVAGGALITEGLAKYTEAVLMEEAFGKGAVWQLSETAQRTYFSGRSFASEPEPPIYLEEGEHYLAYGKSFISLFAIKELIGTDKFNAALKSIYDRHHRDVEPSLISLELIEALQHVTPAEFHILLDDWLKRVITYDLRMEECEVKELANGQYQVDITVYAQRFETLADGSTREISINEPIPIGLFTKQPRELGEEDQALYYQLHPIDQATTHLSLIVDERPEWMAIDPFGTRLDANRLDNSYQ